MEDLELGGSGTPQASPPPWGAQGGREGAGTGVHEAGERCGLGGSPGWIAPACTRSGGDPGEGESRGAAERARPAFPSPAAGIRPSSSPLPSRRRAGLPGVGAGAGKRSAGEAGLAEVRGQ